MLRFLCVLLFAQLAFGYSVKTELWDDINIDDLIDEDYNEEAFWQNQDSIDDRLKSIISSKTKAAGYPLEIHTVVTEDGYILTVHRIPYAPSNANVKNKPVVFLQHGLLSCSYHWLTLGPGKGLGYFLADAGYDVWMGNVRGNSYSKSHIKLNPKKSDFWDFGWNEIGYYDLPAMIDYVLKNTNQAALNYVGHSQGTTSFFVMASSRPEYNQKIKAMHALAPIAYMSNMDNPFFRILGPVIGNSKTLSGLIGSNEFFPNSKLLTFLGAALCKDGSIFQGICTNTLFLVAGFSHDNMNATLLPEILQTAPAGASSNQLIHYAQGISSGKFRNYDFGFTKNMFKYISATPPEYTLNKVTTPMHLYYSRNDWLAAVKDVQILASKLVNLVYNKQVSHDTFNHLDFMWGTHVVELVYNDLLENIRKYT